ncbi:MAG: phosphate ABC transporter permease PstA [Bacteroidia bacterium]
MRWHPLTVIAALATLTGLGVFISIFGYLLTGGIKVLSWEFLTDLPRENMVAGGIGPVIWGSLWISFLALVFALPLGIGAGAFLAEFNPLSKMTPWLDALTNTLSGVPSIVFGLFGMTFFVVGLGWGSSILAGAVTLALLALPILIRTTQEALHAVPKELKLASAALGATTLQTFLWITLPMAGTRIITGTILAFGRIFGETAPILFTVAAYYLPTYARSPLEPSMLLPYHLYVLVTSGTQIEKARPIALGTALVLTTIALLLSLLATWLRTTLSKKHG